MIFQVI